MRTLNALAAAVAAIGVACGGEEKAETGSHLLLPSQYEGGRQSIKGT